MSLYDQILKQLESAEQYEQQFQQYIEQVRNRDKTIYQPLCQAIVQALKKKEPLQNFKAVRLGVEAANSENLDFHQIFEEKCLPEFERIVQFNTDDDNGSKYFSANPDPKQKRYGIDISRLVLESLEVWAKEYTCYTGSEVLSSFFETYAKLKVRNVKFPMEYKYYSEIKVKNKTTSEFTIKSKNFSEALEYNQSIEFQRKEQIRLILQYKEIKDQLIDKALNLDITTPNQYIRDLKIVYNQLDQLLQRIKKQFQQLPVQFDQDIYLKLSGIESNIENDCQLFQKLQAGQLNPKKYQANYIFEKKTLQQEKTIQEQLQDSRIEVQELKIQVLNLNQERNNQSEQIKQLLDQKQKQIQDNEGLRSQHQIEKNQLLKKQQDLEQENKNLNEILANLRKQLDDKAKDQVSNNEQINNLKQELERMKQQQQLEENKAHQYQNQSDKFQESKQFNLPYSNYQKFQNTNINFVESDKNNFSRCQSQKELRNQKSELNKNISSQNKTQNRKNDLSQFQMRDLQSKHREIVIKYKQFLPIHDNLWMYKIYHQNLINNTIFSDQQNLNIAALKFLDQQNSGYYLNYGLYFKTDLDTLNLSVSIKNSDKFQTIWTTPPENLQTISRSTQGLFEVSIKLNQSEMSQVLILEVTFNNKNIQVYLPNQILSLIIYNQINIEEFLRSWNARKVYRTEVFYYNTWILSDYKDIKKISECLTQLDLNSIDPQGDGVDFIQYIAKFYLQYYNISGILKFEIIENNKMIILVGFENQINENLIENFLSAFQEIFS